MDGEYRRRQRLEGMSGSLVTAESGGMAAEATRGLPQIAGKPRRNRSITAMSGLYPALHAVPLEQHRVPNATHGIRGQACGRARGQRQPPQFVVRRELE